MKNLCVIRLSQQVISQIKVISPFYEDRGYNIVAEVVESVSRIPFGGKYPTRRELDNLEGFSVRDYRAEDKSLKPHCHKCRWAQRVPGHAHIKCVHDSLDNKMRLFYLRLVVQKSAPYPNPIDVWGQSHAIRRGWFGWPELFDPTWLIRCFGYEEK